MNKKITKVVFKLFFLCLTLVDASAQKISVGDGSYTTSFPGTDAAGRNGFPSGSPQIIGNATGKPVPTNDWWSKLIKENHAANLFNYPMTLKTVNEGLVLTYIPWGVIGDNEAIRIGLEGLNASQSKVSDYSDWTVTMNWKDAQHEMSATSGIGMPFVYFEKNNEDKVVIKVSSGTVTISQEILIIKNASGGANFVVYAPTGSTWSNSGNLYSSTLNEKNYWSVAMLPQDQNNVEEIANDYKKYAYTFPKTTEVSWSYDKTSAKVTTDFQVIAEVKEGTQSEVLLGLLPHQWDHLSPNSSIPNGYSYQSVRGEIKTLASNSFSVENKFSGILPTMPYLANYSDKFNPSALASKIDQIKNDGLSDWTDSYNEGQVMNRLIQSARIADQTGDIESRDKMIATIKERLEDWLSYQSGEKAFLFYYNSNWTALLGYPSGHGQDTNINDHHFHWGYFIHAAAFMEQYEPGWANKWGDFVNHLVRDAASADRNDAKFPFLRNFSPYAGHCWANGFATFPQGNDQESTSESMQFNSALIHWGTITENDEIRDLGIYLYTTEQTAVEEYWFDIHERNFKSDQRYGLVSRVWGNSYDNGTFWTSDITASYGIELYPIHGGSLYLAHHQDYVQKIWNEVETNTGILSDNDKNPNLWHDTFWKYLSFSNPEKAIDLYNASKDRNLKFGVSDVQTYHWIHAMNALGTLQPQITSDYPITAVFDKDGQKTYVVHNYQDNPITVNFSDGYRMEVLANKMSTSKDIDVEGVISSDFDQAYIGGSVNVEVQTTGEVTKVAFYDNGVFVAEDQTKPYAHKITDLEVGTHGLSAKIYQTDDLFVVTNSVSVVVGIQQPYSGSPILIPGTFEAGHYDKYQGGVGQNISYVDTSQDNKGEFRSEEYVDATVVNGEGATVGWVAPGEWLEYTIEVQNAGYYELSFRYASGNSNGGGPFHLEMNNQKISSDISVSKTSDTNWTTFRTKTVSNISLNKGEQILKIAFDGGEFNLGKMTLTYQSSFSEERPYADAGEPIKVRLPASSALLDGSASTGASDKSMVYEWDQVYGPSVVAFENNSSAKTSITNLVEGVYKFRLIVGYDTYKSTSEVMVIVTDSEFIAPDVSISSPAQNMNYIEGQEIEIIALATDLDGEIVKVEFYDGTYKIGEDTTFPFAYNWTEASLGSHDITAKATDNDGAESISKVLQVTVDEKKSCSEFSSQASQGSFSKGYNITFETIGSNVTITLEMLDTDKNGLVAYLWQKSPFIETPMDHVSGKTFTKKVGNLTAGQTITYACKVDFAGGLAVTKFFSYTVGESCNGSGTFSLPTNNFKIKTTGETCPNEENGRIDIEAKLAYTYLAKLNNKSYDFTGDDLSIPNLSPGDYQLCIEVLGKEYEQCYELVIEESNSVSVTSVEKNKVSSIEVEQGTAPYKIFVNGEKILTSSASNITIPVVNGDVLEVFSNNDCEGSYRTQVFLEQEVRMYPNPTKDKINIYLSDQSEEVSIEVYNTLSKLILSKVYTPTNNIITIDLSHLPAGVYYLKSQVVKNNILKIIKR